MPLKQEVKLKLENIEKGIDQDRSISPKTKRSLKRMMVREAVECKSNFIDDGGYTDRSKLSYPD